MVRKNALLTDDFVFGDGLCLDPVEKVGEDRLDVFPDISGHDQEEQVVSRCESTALGLDDNVEDPRAFEKFLAMYNELLGVGGDDSGTTQAASIDTTT